MRYIVSEVLEAVLLMRYIVSEVLEAVLLMRYIASEVLKAVLLMRYIASRGSGSCFIDEIHCLKRFWKLFY